MHLNYTNGCICTSLTIDDNETIDIEIGDFKKVIKQLLHLDKLKENNDIIIDFFEDLICVNEPKIITSEFDDLYDIRLFEYKINDILLSFTEVFYGHDIYINHKLWNKDINNDIFTIIESLIDECDDIAILQTFFCNVLENCGKLEKDYPHHCDCCGDWIYSYNLDV